MRLIYFLLPFVSSALANSLIQCPCQKQDCSVAADQCACENQNIVNKYFCCDANTAPPTDLGLKDCEPGKASSLKVHNLQFCGGPLDLKCLPQDTCTPIPGNWAETPLALGLCSHLDQPSGVSRSSSSIMRSTVTSTVFVTSTLVFSPTSSSTSSRTSSVPISTSTVVVVPTSSSSSIFSVPISTSTVVVVPTSTSSSIFSVPISTSTVVETTTAVPTRTSSSTPSVPITTATVVEMTTLVPSTLVTVTTTAVVTASAKSSPLAMDK